MIYLSLKEQIDLHIMVNRQLPEILAQLVQSGKKDEALSLLVEWGIHSKANYEVWESAKELLAVRDGPWKILSNERETPVC